MTFAAGAILSSGISVDIIKDWRGKYNSAKKAQSILSEKKGGIRDWADELLSDFPLIRDASAKPGDIVLVNYSGKDLMGVCVGKEIAVLGKDHLEFIPSSHVVTTWGIGHK